MSGYPDEGYRLEIQPLPSRLSRSSSGKVDRHWPAVSANRNRPFVVPAYRGGSFFKNNQSCYLAVHVDLSVLITRQLIFLLMFFSAVVFFSSKGFVPTNGPFWRLCVQYSNKTLLFQATLLHKIISTCPYVFPIQTTSTPSKTTK